jgi:hypothetical protein
LIPTFITFYHINKKSKIDIANLIGSEEWDYDPVKRFF